MPEKVTDPGASKKRAAWQRPTIQKVGDVGDVFRMPGAAKLSMVADDTGDAPRKPKGQE